MGKIEGAMPSTAKTSRKISPVQKRDSVEELDALYEYAGLRRSLRGKAGARPVGAQPDRKTPEELNRPAPEPTVAANGVHWLPVPGWEQHKWLRAGFSTRKGGLSHAYCAEEAAGELNLGFKEEDSQEAVAGNRRLLAGAVMGSAETQIVALKQIHSNLVRLATSADAERAQPWKADGHFTAEPGILLAAMTADCIPVLVADPRNKVVAAFHAGWRGTVKRIVELGVGRMRLEFGSRPEDLIAAIGPGVGPCCYAVGEEVRSEFESQFAYAGELFHEVYDSDPVRTKYPMLFLTQRAPGHSEIGPSLHLDLIEANRRQLLDAGLKAQAIKVIGGCTSCRTDLFFSHRASDARAGRMMAVIGIAPTAGRK
ncbi:MAG: peptidoglycan editing factor PgeF [Terracidiphilus sp.]|nr:peptidoglycan editing factor PgeF [Terracidiphilus sp.]